ncbi:ABC transporter ATP-binding protein [Gorillibacterium massiliense]|uniref:ABC transporter ATP-binding protein n=1 Tax=Gorillibacterium massiliense TaxID=1280390 RepID=UPI0004B1223D|nr:ABC transporter ATP-binding protein [Gorillibacterium massiliense]
MANDSVKCAGSGQAIVEVDGVTKVFGGKKAAQEVSFTIGRGECVAILGANGAGKTTLLTLLLGLKEPTDGKIKLFGMEPKAREVRERTGAMLQEVSVMDGLKARELIELFRHYYPRPMSMERLAAFTGLSPDDMEKRTEKLSGGQRRRLNFALALAGDPDLLIVDEPTVGMDVLGRKAFWEQIKSLTQAGKTVLFSTHYLQEAEDAADRILFFRDGALIADGSPERMKAGLIRKAVSIRKEEGMVDRLMERITGVTGYEEKNGRIFLYTEDTDALLAELFAGSFQVCDIAVEKGKLDDAFSQLTGYHEEVAEHA